MVDEKILLELNNEAERKRRENQRILDDLNRRAGKPAGFSFSFSMLPLIKYLKRLWRKIMIKKTKRK